MVIAPGRIQRPTSAAAAAAGGYGDPHHPPSSRGSIVGGAPPMPSIVEDEIAYRLSVTSRHPNIIWPRTPLRVPQKSSRRALMARENTAAVTEPPAAGLEADKSAPSAATSTAASSPARRVSSPPPYVPVTHLPPQYREKLPSETSESEGTQKAIGTTQPASASSRSGAAEERGRAGSPEGGGKLGLLDRQWLGRRRATWCIFAALGLLILAVTVGLAVGLTLGLKNRGSYKGSAAADDDNKNNNGGPNPIFPAGSYSFETTLQHESSACTSRESTWRCYPYTPSSNATFFWAIDRSPSGGKNEDDAAFVVSSRENPFTPSFTNLTASFLDAGRDGERLVFGFDMDRTTIHPPDARDPSNRAARCTFRGARFQATLWTRRGRSGGSEGDVEVDTGQRFAAWPGDVEVVLSKESEIGEPRCEDDRGNDIADVQASAGDCSCDYASFKLD